MRMSCNGCRILRKGCNDECVLRPCLEWIKSPESQANATVFLAKFYGRAGLVNLISAAPLQHRTAIFRSLLYEACGRIINPIYGAVGLMWSGSWEQCQSAVESVLNGSATIHLPSDHSTTSDGNAPVAVLRPITALNGNCDIRHLNKGPGGGRRKGSKRFSGGTRGKARMEHITTTTITTDNPHEPVAKFSISGWNWEGHGQGADHDDDQVNYGGAVSNDSSNARTVEPTLVHSDDQGVETCTSEEYSEDLLELTLGWNHVVHSHRS